MVSLCAQVTVGRWDATSNPMAAMSPCRKCRWPCRCVRKNMSDSDIRYVPKRRAVRARSDARSCPPHKGSTMQVCHTLAVTAAGVQAHSAAIPNDCQWRQHCNAPDRLIVPVVQHQVGVRPECKTCTRRRQRTGSCDSCRAGTYSMRVSVSTRSDMTVLRLQAASGCRQKH